MEANFAISLVVSEMLTWICLGGLAVFVIFSYFPPMIDRLCLTQSSPRYHFIVSYADGQLILPKTPDLVALRYVTIVFSDFCAHMCILSFCLQSDMFHQF